MSVKIPEAPPVPDLPVIEEGENSTEMMDDLHEQILKSTVGHFVEKVLFNREGRYSILTFSSGMSMVAHQGGVMWCDERNKDAKPN